MTGNLTGTRLSFYELREQIGGGGMGAVYRAYQPSMKREVAIKVLPAYLSEAPGYRERFNREVQVTALLEHPAILPIYEAGEAEGIAFIVMRLLTGGSLDDRLRQEGRWPAPAESLAILQQIAGGLDYAHQRGVVHRDIKPSNILFDASGNVYLTDFGIAKLMRATEVRVTSEPVLVGTPAYISPEQARAEPVDSRADLYGFGVIAYQLLNGALPFSGTHPMQVLLKHVQDDLPRGELAAPVWEVLRKMLSKKPEDRYATAGEFVSELRTALQAQGSLETLSAPMPSQPVLPAPVAQTIPPVPVPAHDDQTLVNVILPVSRKSTSGIIEAAAGCLGILVAVILTLTMRPAGLSLFLTTALAGAGAFFAVRGFMLRREEPSRPKAAAAPLISPPASPPATRGLTIYSLDSGDRIGDYQLQDRLDAGERTRVYHAIDLRHDRHVALKLIGTDDTRGTRAERFKREARLLGRLHHAHIVPFLDFDNLDFVCFIAMPFLTGRSLKFRLEQENRLPLPRVVEILTQVAAALDYLHGESIIHRDLKPSNVVFDESGNAYLADLGIAKAFDDSDDAHLTRVGQTIGTPAYMPPEQWLGANITPAADQYSLGCIAYEMLTGNPPFAADTPFALMLQHVREAPRLPSHLRTDLPAAVDGVLLKALEKDPVHRHANAIAFAIELRNAGTTLSRTIVTATIGHVFISYSREDGDYAYKLADRIRAAGLDVWIDARLEPSDRWWRKIVDAIDGCVAFVAIMSPTAAESKWVEREVLLADQKNKPAFPLLLKGEPLPIYVNTQYIDVTGDRLPPDPFYERLTRAAKRT